MPSAAAVQVEAFEAVRLAWPTLSALLPLPSGWLGVVAEPWRLAGSRFPLEAGEGGRVVLAMSEGDFYALPCGPGLAGVGEVAWARAEGGLVVAYMATAMVLVPMRWRPESTTTLRVGRARRPPSPPLSGF